jgi:hypothetical protein
MSLLARATQQDNFCALIDGQDAFDPASAEASGVNLSRLLWVRCGKTKQKLKPLEQAFKVADMLVQSAGFGLIVVDLCDFPERLVRRVPHTSWFRFSRVVERQPTALVFLGTRTTCHKLCRVGVVAKKQAGSWEGKPFHAVRHGSGNSPHSRKEASQAVRPLFSLRSQWAA